MNLAAQVGDSGLPLSRHTTFKVSFGMCMNMTALVGDSYLPLSGHTTFKAHLSWGVHEYDYSGW